MREKLKNRGVYNGKPNHSEGMTLIELMIVLAIFSVVMAGLYSAYSVQMKQGVKEYRLAESEIELQIAKSVIERDMAMAGFGLADDYSGLTFTPVPVAATNDNPDILTLMGTALGRESRASQAWSYAKVAEPAVTTHYQEWTDSSVSPAVPDARENLKNNDRIIYIEPNAKKLMVADGGSNGTTGKTWLFVYPPSGDPATSVDNSVPTLADPGVLVFGLQTASGSTAAFPYYVVNYSLGGTAPTTCAKNTQNLLRGESRTNNPPSSLERQPLLNCVLDFEVAFGLDTDENGSINCWDDGGGTAAGYTNGTLKTRLIQVRGFILVQDGNYDQNYTYSNPDPAYNTSAPDKILVGDSVLTKCGGPGLIGREITLSAEQRKYRWRMITLSVTPRNLR